MQKRIKINETIADKIRSRYKFSGVSERTISYSTVVIDNILPIRVYNALQGRIELPPVCKGYCTISERAAHDLGIPKLHISELIEMLGYTPENIKDLLLTVKGKKPVIVLVGVEVVVVVFVGVGVTNTTSEQSIATESFMSLLTY